RLSSGAVCQSLPARVGIIIGRPTGSTARQCIETGNYLMPLSHAPAACSAQKTGRPTASANVSCVCRPWAPAIAPVAVVVAETIGADEALVSLICGQCFTGDWTQPLIEALRRDLGFRLEQFVCEPPTGIEH